MQDLITTPYFYVTNILLEIPKHSNLIYQITQGFQHLEVW
jgi:hypothetical protein